jgi:hypothetical protein
MMGSLQPPAATAPAVGVLTKTVVRSPVCKFILHARVRHPDLNDVVFVGEDFIHVKQVKRNGDVCHLEHVATKDDFGTRIRAAKTFTVDPNPTQDGDDFIKPELANSQSKRANTTLPPQLVVLTLESDALLFLYLKDDGTGVLEFVHQSCPMPSYDNAIHQTGDHLAIDTSSRALAIAASEREVIIYSSKPTEQFHHELGTGHPDWCPVSSQRPLAVNGVIQHLEFLRPPDKDPDHIILLVVVIDQRRTKALWIDWYGNTQLRHASVHPAQPIDAPRTVSNLLIPIRDAAFLMITGSEMKLHKDILSGSMRSLSLNPAVPQTTSPGQSSRKPVWTSWCRPLRNRTMQDDVFYLIREDGLVLLITITNIDTIHTTHAGDIGCHAGSAFASLGDPSDPDILAVIGDMSNGQVVHMGNWPSPARITERSRVQTMEMQASMTLPNWTPSVDMIVSRLSQSHSRSTRMSNRVFVTSGRQPHGAITELRKGFEAITTTYFEIGGLRSTIGAWVLPNVSTGSILILLSTPSSTRLIDLDPDLEASELDESATAVMALDQRTLTAAILENGHLVQVCERAICTSANVSANFEDQSRWDSETGDTIVAAAIEPRMNCIVVANRCSDHSELLVFRHHAHRDDDATNGPDEGLHSLPPIVLSEEPICLATTVYKGRVIGIISTIEGNIQLFTIDPRSRPVVALGESLQIVEDRQSLCDHLALLHPAPTNGESPHDLIAVCGLRDGSIVSVRIKTADASTVFGEMTTTEFGQETTRLSRHADESGKAYALSGLSTCVLTWDDTTSCSPNFESLWVSDKSRPQLSQGPVTAVTMMPSSDYLSTYGVGSLANHLVIVSSSEVCFASVEQDTTTVPRQIEVSGTPGRLIYVEHQRSFVCASMCSGARSFASDMRNAPPVEKRQAWPVIDFIPADKDNVSFTFDLQPGERVYALAEWSFLHHGKWYSSIMVGGSYTRKSGGLKGRIAFLQPTIRNWEIVDVKEARSTNFDDPVYALALFDTVTYVACIGTKVVASRFDVEEKKWETICAPFRLSHSGTSISVSGSLIYISAANEGLITLRLENLPSKDEDDDYAYRLTLVAQPPRSSQSLSHTILPLNPDTNIALLSTQDRLLLGLTSPSPNSPNPHRTRLLFEAQLPRSLSSIRQGSTRPSWRTKPSSGVLTSNLVGLSSDGSMTGISIIDKPLWRRLFWLQRILEWDDTFSPHAPETPTYGVDAEAYEGRDRGVPIGFGAAADDEIALFADDDISLQNDLHVDGDVLARVLEPCGVRKLEEALENLAERDDRIGEWVEEHLERELGLVEGIVEEVRVLLGMWM